VGRSKNTREGRPNTGFGVVGLVERRVSDDDIISMLKTSGCIQGCASDALA
jgi:hypothetical protein